MNEPVQHEIGQGRTLFERGRTAMDAGRFEEALALFDESAKIEPHFKTYELMGECLLSLNRNPEAVLPLAAATGLGTKPFRSLYLLSKALARIGRRTDAVEKLRLAVAMNPDYKAARELLDTIG